MLTELEILLLLSLWLTVDPDEIRRLGKRFRKLDLDNSGSLSVEEFMSLPDLQQNPLVQRVIDIFDTDGNGEVDFKGIWLAQVFKKVILKWCANITMLVNFRDLNDNCEFCLQSLLRAFHCLAFAVIKKTN